MRRNFANRWVVSFAALAAAGSPMWANGQDRDGVRGVREQDAAAARTANQLDATAQSGATVPGQMSAGTDLLMQAGIVLDARNPNRMIVERVIPNTPAFLSGLRPGDVVTRVNGSPVTSLAAVAQALLNGTGGRLGLQVDRNGQSRQLNLALSDVRTAMRPDINANAPATNAANQNNAAAATTVGGVPINGIGTPGTPASGVTRGLGTTTAQSAGGQANATGQPSGAGQGTATAPGQAGRTTQGASGTVTGTLTTTSGQPTTTTGTPPIVPGIPTSPSLPGNPTSPSLLVQPGGIPTALPGLPTAVPGRPTAVPGLPTATPGLPTAVQGTVPPSGASPPSVPSSQGTVNPTIGGGNSPPVTGIGTTGTGATSATSSQGTVSPGVGGGTTSGAGTGGIGGTTGAAGAGAGTSSGATGGAAGAGGAAAGGAGMGGGAGGGAGAGGT